MRGIVTVGPTDHGFCKSIYFFDPSGHRMEMTTRCEKPGELERFRTEAYALLREIAIQGVDEMIARIKQVAG